MPDNPNGLRIWRSSRLFDFASETGEILFEFDTVQNYGTVNGVPGLGGAIDAHGIAAGGALLLVNSGHGRLGGTPSKVLLALKAKPE